MPPEERQLTDEELDNMELDNEAEPEEDDEFSPEMAAYLSELLEGAAIEESDTEGEEGAEPAMEEEPAAEEIPPAEELPAEETPLEQTEEVQKSEQQQDFEAAMNEIVQAFANEQGLELPVAAKLAVQLAEKLNSIKGNKSAEEIPEAEMTPEQLKIKQLEQRLAERDLDDELKEIKGFKDFGQFDAAMKEYLAEHPELHFKKGSLKQAYEVAKGRAYKGEDEVLENALKNPDVLKKLADNPELKRMISESLIKNQHETNLKIPPTSPPGGGTVRQEMKRPTNFDEAGDMMFEAMDTGKRR